MADHLRVRIIVRGIDFVEKIMHRTGYVGAVVMLLGIIGCGDGLKRVPVQGKITVKGEPLADAVIQFLPAGSTKGEGGIGRSDGGGNFTLVGSREGHSGVAPGEYKVRVSRIVDRDGTVLDADSKQADHPGSKESIPEKYASPDTPLTAKVPEQGGPVSLDIPEKLVVVGKKK
jgi:hypothetical protein